MARAQSRIRRRPEFPVMGLRACSGSCMRIFQRMIYASRAAREGKTSFVGASCLRAEARTRRGKGILWRGGESGSQSALKVQAFSTFLEQNPPFELPPENGIQPRQGPVPSNGP